MSRPSAEVIARLNAALDGRYTVTRAIGRGGMATVFLARDLKLQRDVAIKVLHQELGATLGSERFLSEIRTTANMHHPHILPLFDSGSTDGFVYFVMPFIDGETLREKMAREGQLDIADAVRIAQGAASALEHAHARSIVHRDIKPENILLQDGQALVADFGIALAIKSAAEARITHTGFSVGTPTYMSPEQATAERHIDGRSDQYALALVLYEMLVGEPPFTGPSAPAITARLLKEVPRPIVERRPSTPRYLADAIARALGKTPSERFASVAEFSAALNKPSTEMYRVAGATMTSNATLWSRIHAGITVSAVVAAAYFAYRAHVLAACACR